MLDFQEMNIEIKPKYLIKKELIKLNLNMKNKIKHQMMMIHYYRLVQIKIIIKVINNN